MQSNINVNWLHHIAEQISLNNVTVAEAAAQAQFDSPYGRIIRQISTSSLRSHFATHGISYNTSKGRKKEEVPKDIEKKIFDIQIYLQCGEKVAFYTLLFDNPEITFTHVRKTFEKYKLYKYRSQKKKEKQRCRYEAKYVSQIWHADIHYFQKVGMPEMMYLYCIIDDKSRYIIYAELLPRKTAELCAQVLKKAIDIYGPPCMIWTDNGGENNGQIMRDFLKQYRIYPVFTEPGNPEQNGKIERFWEKLEENTYSPSDIFDYIYKYNMVRAHMSLQCGKRYLRPKDVFFDKELHWKRGYEWKWFVDGKEQDFPIDKKKKSIYFD